ncbi:MAG TPA: ATP-binding protein [Chitinophagaceae bacterium]|jgi:signal transduction histidine kinase|nr:ATP-binding protein [Chitinophagaceae bacterium]
MGQTEIRIFIILTGIIVLVFVAGIILFLFQYRQRRLQHEQEKKQINEQHQIDLLNTQVVSQQETMQHIGHEIHDSLAQKLTLASIYTNRLEFETSSSEEKLKLSGISKILQDSLLEIRQLSQTLTENRLQKDDLEELIRIECEQVNATGICSASFEMNGLPPLSIAAKSSLLRIVQEFIQNSIKHSGCKRIILRSDHRDEQLSLILEDDGKGFEPDKPEHKGIGLDSIRRRIQVLGGHYHLKSHPGSGVQLTLTIPVIPVKN